MPMDVSPTQSDHVILDQFLPEEQEIADLRTILPYIYDQLNRLMNRLAISGFIKFIGSTALETFTRGDLDIDIFMVVDVETLNEFKQIFQYFNHLEWVQDQHIKHGHEPNRESLTKRLTIWSGTVKRAHTKRYQLDLVILPRVGGLEQHIRFETLRHVDLFKNNLSGAQKKDVVRLKGLFKLGGIYGADQWGIKGVDCQTLIYKYNTLERALHFLSNLTITTRLNDPSYNDARIDRNLFATIFQSPLASIRLTQIRDIAHNYLQKKEPPRSFEIDEWIDHQAEINHVVYRIPLQGADRAETFAKAVSLTKHAIKYLGGTFTELRDIKYELDARLFDKTTIISLKLQETSPIFKRYLDKTKLVNTKRESDIQTFIINSKQRARPPLITDIRIKETEENITTIVERNIVFMHYLTLRVIQHMFEERKLIIDYWIENKLDYKIIQNRFQSDQQSKVDILLHNLDKIKQYELDNYERTMELDHNLEVYYSLATYILLPSLLGVSKNTEIQLNNYLKQTIDSLPKNVLLQITALLHNLGLFTNQFSPNKKYIGENFDLKVLGSIIELTTNQINYVTTLIEVVTSLNFKLEALCQDIMSDSSIQEVPSLALLIYAHNMVYNRSRISILKKNVRCVLDRYFES